MGLVPFSNAGNLIKGYLLNTSYFGGYGILATIPVLAAAWVFLAKNKGVATSMPFILFPFALYYALSTQLSWDSSSLSIETRRYLDPTIPFIVVGVVVGLREAWRLWNTWYETRYRPRLSNTPTGASLMLTRLVRVSGELGFFF